MAVRERRRRTGPYGTCKTGKPAWLACESYRLVRQGGLNLSRALIHRTYGSGNKSMIIGTVKMMATPMQTTQ